MMTNNASTSARPGAKSGAAGGWFSTRGNRLLVYKLALIVALIAFIAYLLSSNSAKDVPMDWLKLRLSSDSAVQNLREGDVNAFLDRFGTEPTGAEGWFLFISDDLMDVSELLVVKAFDSAVLDAIEDAVNERLNTQKESFRNYGTNQYDLLNHAICTRRGMYLFYGVSERVGQWEENFLSLIR